LTLRNIFDIAIIGGGLCGSTTAVLLQKAGYATAVIEKTALGFFKQGESLSPQCKSFFHVLGVSFDSTEAIEYYGIDSTWGSNEANSSSFIFNAYGNGLAVDRDKLEKKLIGEAAKNGAVVRLSSEIKEILYSNGSWEIKTENKKEIGYLRAKLIVIATGRNSFQRLNRCSHAYHDSLMALTMVIGHPSRSLIKNFLTISAADNGWLYSNHLPGNRMILSFFTDSDMVPNARPRLKHLFEQAHPAHGGPDPGVPEGQKLFVSNARTSWTEVQSGSFWVRAGDSAYTIDPLSGQGILKNFEMTHFLVEHIRSFLDNHQKIHQDYFSYNHHHFMAYLSEQKKVYQLEQRWAKNPFWDRRSLSW